MASGIYIDMSLVDTSYSVTSEKQEGDDAFHPFLPELRNEK
jgi:hypothetical protein